MESLFKVDWQSLFTPTGSLLEVFIRGTIMYFAMYALLRIFRRQAGTIGIADLLVIVVIADAAQNGMAGDAKSVTEAVLLVSTIVVWDWIIDWMGFKSSLLSRFLEPKKLLLVKNGRLHRANLDSELITDEELMTQLRLQGVGNLDEVERCYLESNGRFSVVRKGSDDKQASNESGPSTVN
jgi:uncharacterized membrane protein YcaP (DUF421 family)